MSPVADGYPGPMPPVDVRTIGTGLGTGLGRGLGALGGRALAAATSAVAAVRPAPKPLHPDGVVLHGRLRRTGSAQATGVPWLDEPGRDTVVLRTSRAVGLRPPWPDVHGLAVRVLDGDAGTGDLLLASTGSGRVGRFLLTAAVDPHRWPLTTLLPYRTPSGPVVVAARWEEWGEYALSWAHPTGPWHPFGALVPTRTEHEDQTISFDPVRRQLPGLEQYPAVVRLREPAYARARRSRTS